jgi:galactokinase
MGKPSLRHADMTLLNSNQNSLSDLEYRRAKHVITENERVHETVNALQIGDIKTLSQLFSDSHESMKSDFEITTPAIDGLVDIIRKVLGEHGGVRMTGGGFGGCVIALAPKALMANVQQAVAEQYQAQSGLKEDFYICSIENGAFA